MEQQTSIVSDYAKVSHDHINEQSSIDSLNTNSCSSKNTTSIVETVNSIKCLDDIEMADEEDNGKVPLADVYNEDLEEDNSNIEEGEEEEDYFDDSEEDEANESDTTPGYEMNSEVKEWLESKEDTSVNLENNNELSNNILFPGTESAFHPFTGGYVIKQFPQIPLLYYQFTSNEHNYFFICIDTLKFLFLKKNRKLRGISINIINKENIKKKQEILAESLKSHGVIFTCPYESGVCLTFCKWSTLVLITNIKLPFDLTISGGGFGEFDEFSAFRCKQYEDIALSYKERKNEHVTIGIIDTGSMPPSSFVNKCVDMHFEMYNTNFKIPRYTKYQDNIKRHGTGVAEIIINSIFPGFKIYIARISNDKQKKIQSRNIISAMEEFQRLKVDVINCSFSGQWKDDILVETLKSLQATGTLVVASAGNGGLDNIISDLNNGKTIMVGSHDKRNYISSFSNGKCSADICSLGEDVSMTTIQPNKRSGTSYASPQVASVVANYVAFASTQERQPSYIKTKLRDTAADIICCCDIHKGKCSKRKMNTIGFMKTVHFDDDRPTSSKHPKIEIEIKEDIQVGKDKKLNSENVEIGTETS